MVCSPPEPNPLHGPPAQGTHLLHLIFMLCWKAQPQESVTPEPPSRVQISAPAPLTRVLGVFLAATEAVMAPSTCGGCMGDRNVLRQVVPGVPHHQCLHIRPSTPATPTRPATPLGLPQPPRAGHQAQPPAPPPALQPTAQSTSYPGSQSKTSPNRHPNKPSGASLPSRRSPPRPCPLPGRRFPLTGLQPQAHPPLPLPAPGQQSVPSKLPGGGASLAPQGLTHGRRSVNKCFRATVPRST